MSAARKSFAEPGGLPHETNGHSPASFVDPFAESYALRGGDGAHDEHGSASNAFRIAHRLLRGRYLITIVLAVVFAVVGGVLGYRSQTPKFRAAAIIRVSPVELTAEGRDSVMPMFRDFMSSQAGIITGPRVTGNAANDADWLDLAAQLEGDPQRVLTASLSASTPRTQPQNIYVSVTHKSKDVAVTGLRAVLESYGKLSRLESDGVLEARIQFAEDRRGEHEQDIRDRQQRIDSLRRPFGVQDLDQRAKDTYERARNLSGFIDELKRRLANARTGTPHGDALFGPNASADEIAAVDPRMADLLATLRRVESALRRERESGKLDKHPDVQFLIDEVDGAGAAVTAYRGQVLAQFNDGFGAPGAQSVEQIEATIAELEEDLKEVEDEANRVSQVSASIAVEEREIENSREKLEQANANIAKWEDDRRLRSTVGRVDIPTKDEIEAPSRPTVDDRKKFGAMGFVGAGSVPVLAILALGLLDRRLRYSDDTGEHTQGAEMLGVLPDLSDRANAAEAASAAHSVHQMRTMIQIAGGIRARSISFTSATAGDGKTSLTLAMGISFAASGANTILLDLDMVGQGLSRCLGARPEQGVGSALASPDAPLPVQKTSVPNLCLLPTAPMDDRRASSLSGPSVAKLLERLTAEFDQVLVDTGPILGSIEANFVCSLTDRTVVVVGRGQSRPFVRRALDRLERLHAHVAGLVFNRASMVDFSHSATSKSFRSVRPDPTVPAVIDPDRLGVFAGVDPISRLVVTEVLAEQHGA